MASGDVHFKVLVEWGDIKRCVHTIYMNAPFYILNNQVPQKVR